MSNKIVTRSHDESKHTPRSEELIASLDKRLDRISGQIQGRKKMVDSNHGCEDILIQIGAVEKALESVGYMLFYDHLKTCVSESIINGDTSIIDETVEIIKKMK